MVPTPVKIKDLVEPRSIHELPPRTNWCKLRRWTAEHAYTLLFLAGGNPITWGLVIYNIMQSGGHR